MNEYRLEVLDFNVVARVYVDGKKTSAYTTVIPDELKDAAATLQNEEDQKPF